MKKYLNFCKKHLDIILIFLFSFTIITICSKNSFLYLFSNYDDTNCFRYIGQQIYRGAVPYTEIWEQKGPSLLYLNAILAWLSDLFIFTNRYFIGFYIFDIISTYFYLYISWKIIKLINPNANKIYAILPGIVYVTKVFRGFGCFEEYMLPLLAYILYTYIKAYITKTPINNKIALLQGIFIAMIFWGKYTVLGIVLAIYLCYGLLCLRLKTFKSYLKFALFNFISFTIFSIIICIILYSQNALNAMIDSYFINNVTSYAQTQPLTGRIAMVLMSSTLFTFLSISPLIFCFIVPKLAIECLFAIIPVITCCLLNNPYGYYEIPLSLFLVLILAFISTKFNFKINKIFKAIAYFLIFNCFWISPNISSITYRKNEYLPFLIQEDIDSKSYTQLVLLDLGCRTILDIPCDTEYISIFNASPEKQIEKICNSMLTNKYDYILVTDKTYELLPTEIKNNYNKKSSYNIEHDYVYSLYKNYILLHRNDIP